MGDATASFFDDLASRGEHRFPETYHGTIRFDLADGGTSDHWSVSIDHGNVTVSRSMDPADCVVHVDRDLFDRLADGQEKWAPLLFRGAYTVEGDLRVFTRFRRLFPGPPGAHHPRDFARSRRQSA